MDIRMYFQKIREIEHGISEPFVVVASLETPEGGKAGHMTEVSRESAARLIVDGKVRLASKAEQEAFLAKQKEALEAAEQEKLAGKIQFTVLPEQAHRFIKQRSEKG